MKRRQIRLAIVAAAWVLALPATATADRCTVTIGFAEPAAVAGVIVDVDYSAAPGEFVGDRDDVECWALVPGGLGSFNNRSQEQILTASVVRLDTFGGSQILSCVTEGEPVVAGDFVVEVVDASNENYEPMDDPPAMEITGIDCGGTVEGPGPGSDCVGSYAVTFGVDGAGELGALQLIIDYGLAPGVFLGSGSEVSCQRSDEASEALATFNNKSGDAELHAAFVAISGMNTPSELMTCAFSAAGAVPLAEDFHVVVDDSAQPDASPVVPAPVVEIVSIVAVGDVVGCGDPVCGNGVLESGEQCDDGNTSNNDACLADCVIAHCGDGHVFEGLEECDKGEMNFDGPDSTCHADCSLPVCGDVDGSGKLTAGDAQKILGAAVGLVADCTPWLCDVNGSGAVTAVDAGMVLGASVGLGVDLGCSATVIVKLDDDVELGSLDVEIGYTAEGASFVGEGEDVECVSLLGDGALVAFNNDMEAGVLRIGIVDPALQGPVPLAVCTVLEGAEGISVDDFVVEVVAASDPGAAPVEDPAVSLTY